jgi:hypothetical protein
MKLVHHLCWFAVFGAGVLCWSQQANPGDVPQPADQPQVRFIFDWNQGRPWLSYSFKVRSNGLTHFDGYPNPAEGGDGEEFQQDLTLSEANRMRIFELAKKTNYFQGDFNFKKKIAQTGQKTLEYQSPDVLGSATYNWSENASIQELTRLFQSIATTLDYGRKLEFQYRFDKLGMDQRIRELEDLQAHGYIEELAAIEPVLRKIANDPSIMHISRQSAKQLLKTIGNSGTAASTQTVLAKPEEGTPQQH